MVLAEGLCDLEGIILAEGLQDLGRKIVPLFLIMPWHVLQLRNSTENLSLGSQLV
jgi:hypothetical protein